MAYTAAPFKLQGPDNWIVIDGRDRIVERDLTKARANTLANVLNFTASAFRMAWWEARKAPPRRS
jgi:hypothetical protein